MLWSDENRSSKARTVDLKIATQIFGGKVLPTDLSKATKHCHLQPQRQRERERAIRSHFGSSLSPLWEPGCHPGDLVGGLRPPAEVFGSRGPAEGPRKDLA